MVGSDSIAERMQKLAKLKRQMHGGDADHNEEAVELAMPDDEARPSIDEAHADDEAHAEFDAAFNIEPRPADPAPKQDEIEAPSIFAKSAGSAPRTSDGQFDLDGPGPDIGDFDEEFAAEALGTVELDEAETEPDNAIKPDERIAVAEAISDFDKDDVESLTAYFASLGIGETEDPETDEPDQADQTVETPDFAANEVDPETLAHEFDHEQPVEETAPSEPEDGCMSITFDASRTTLLNHVSRQMGCTVDDVVVTALDWYLDALFGEDDDEQEARAV